MSLEATLTSGSLLLALPVALAAGLVAFLSPAVLPLVPGYLGYAAGLSATDGRDHPRLASRLLLAGLLFVAGFTLVYVSTGVLVVGPGGVLLANLDVLQRWLGGAVAVLGLVFAGLPPGLGGDRLSDPAPAVALVGALLLGGVLGLGFTPAVGPTLGTVMLVATSPDGAVRGTLLATAYCLGLGAPFVLVPLLVHRSRAVGGWVRAHRVGVRRAGGVLLLAVGLLLATGAWNDLFEGPAIWTNGFTPVV